MRGLEMPATTTPRAVGVWLHGLGAGADDFVPVAQMLARPEVYWLFPQAPDLPVTLNGGYQMPAWYDIRSLEPGPEREDFAQLQQSSAMVATLVEQYCKKLAVDDIIVCGFSQGGAVALDLALRGPLRLKAVVALSTYLAGDRTDATELNANTPAYVGHGTHDDVVPLHRGQHVRDTLTALGRPVTWGEFPMAHSVDAAEIQAIGAFLSKVLD